MAFTFQFSQQFLDKAKEKQNQIPTKQTPKKSEESPVKSITDPRYIRDTFLKNYLQSFLAWMYKQNPEFAYYLREDEIVTWFMHNIKHPEWFNEEEKKDIFKLVADCTDYIRQNMNNADTFTLRMAITCRIKEVQG